MDAIAVDGVTVRYSARVALDTLDLRVGPGEVVGLLGPNGAGKTTTVDACAGLRRPDSGRVRILGRDPRDRAARQRFAVVPQEPGLYPELTAYEHLALFAALYGLRRPRARIDEVLALLGLAGRAKDRVGGYSGGMRRRLALARALLHDPPVLFLDEPTLGVDVHGRRALWDHVGRLRDEGRAVLLTTNYLEEATALCDRVVILDAGRVLADERPDVLRRRGGATLVLTTEGPPYAVARAVTAVTGVPADVADDGTVRLALPGADAVVSAVVAASGAGPVTAIRTEEPSLEDVFLRLTGARA